MQNRRVLLIIGAGIAAYKSLELIRLITRAGGAVTPVLTGAAKEFVTPLSVGGLAGEKVYTHLFVDPWERRELASHCKTGEVDFAAMAHHAQTQHGVTLMGVFVGDPIQRRRRLVPVDRVRAPGK